MCTNVVTYFLLPVADDMAKLEDVAVFAKENHPYKDDLQIAYGTAGFRSKYEFCYRVFFVLSCFQKCIICYILVCARGCMYTNRYTGGIDLGRSSIWDTFYIWR